MSFPRDFHQSVWKATSVFELKLLSSLVKKTLYCMSHTELEDVRYQITKLLDQGYIRRSTCPWGSPVLFVSKKDDGLRFW